MTKINEYSPLSDPRYYSTFVEILSQSVGNILIVNPKAFSGVSVSYIIDFMCGYVFHLDKSDYFAYIKFLSVDLLASFASDFCSTYEIFDDSHLDWRSL